MASFVGIAGNVIERLSDFGSGYLDRAARLLLALGEHGVGPCPRPLDVPLPALLEIPGLLGLDSGAPLPAVLKHSLADLVVLDTVPEPVEVSPLVPIDCGHGGHRRPRRDRRPEPRLRLGRRMRGKGVPKRHPFLGHDGAHIRTMEPRYGERPPAV